MYGFVSDNCYGLKADVVLEAIKDWVDGRSFKTTVPWDDTKSKNVNCYCHDVYKDEATGDFLFVLWKSDPENDKSMVGVKLDSSGNLSKFLKPDTGGDQKDVIWGHPSYYWFVPSKNYMVSVKFDNSRCDSDMVHDWINGCVNFRVKFPGIKTKEQVMASGQEKAFTRVYFDIKKEVIDAAEGNSAKTTGDNATKPAKEGATKADEEFKYKVTFKFKAALKIFSTTEAKINEIAQTTKYVLNRKLVSTYAKDEVLEGWVGGLSRIPVVSKLFSRPSQKTKENLKVELKIETSPSKAEILDIIASSGDTEADGWEKVGFMDQNMRVTWAQEYRLTDSISVEDGGNDVIPAASLFSYLAPKRAEYIASIAKQKELEEAAKATLAIEAQDSVEAKIAETA